MENIINGVNVNDVGGVPSIFDGAGDVEALVSDGAVERLAEATERALTSGQISPEQLVQMTKTRTIVRDHKKIGRNEPCPCGSGKKYKHCCLKTGTYETTHQE